MIRRSLRLLPVLAVTLLAFGLTGCSSMNVTSDFDSAYDFSTATTFAFPPGMGKGTAGAGEVSPLVAKRVMAAIETQLTAKGLAKVTPEEADFIVVPQGGTQQQTEVTSSPYAYTYQPWWGDDVDVYQYTTGTLIIDFVDRRTNDMVWRGSATAVVDDEPKNEKIDDAVNRILANYPPTKGQSGNTHTESGW